MYLKNNMTQEVIGELVGISQPWVSRLIAGSSRSSPSPWPTTCPRRSKRWLAE